jgi:hypothetical protein
MAAKKTGEKTPKKRLFSLRKQVKEEVAAKL